MTIPEYDKECNCELCIKERKSWNSKRLEENNLITKNDDIIMREWIEKTEKRLKRIELSISRAGARYK